MPIEFVAEREDCSFLLPPGFAPEKHSIEYRLDPLTGFRCRLNEKRAARPKQASRESVIEELAVKPPGCPFCPENIEAATPLFPASVCQRGYYQLGDCRLFPNLYPLAPWHANISLSGRHFLSAGDFTATTLEDALKAACAFFGDVRMASGTRLFPVICWNHLPPSGASIIHPHMQVMLDAAPTTYQEILLDKSLEFHRKTGLNYWRELVRVEKARQERFVAENDSVAVLTSFAPQGNHELQMIFREATGLGDLDDATRMDFVSALLKILRYYHRAGVQSFNMTTFSAALGDRLPYYRLSAKIIARPAVQRLYRNDTGAMERLHLEPDIEIAPEAVARAAREVFFDS